MEMRWRALPDVGWGFASGMFVGLSMGVIDRAICQIRVRTKKSFDRFLYIGMRKGPLKLAKKVCEVSNP